MTSMLLSPILLVYQDGVFVPATPYQRQRCEQYFENGKRYPLIDYEDRSIRSHNHYFAALHEAWQNLPEGMADDFPTDTHLRKHALIATGYYHQTSIICESEEEARKVAAFVRPIDEFAVVSIKGCAVIHRTAKSQSRKAMGGKVFNESKQKVLAWVWDLVGVDPEVGNANAGRAA